MPVASYHPRGAGSIGPKQIHAPKEASLKGWWNSCRRVFPTLPRWIDMQDERLEGGVDGDTIHFSWWNGDLFIARKRNLR